MRSRRGRAERSLRTARPRRTTGTILIALGVIAWPIAALLPPLERSLIDSRRGVSCERHHTDHHFRMTAARFR